MPKSIEHYRKAMESQTGKSEGCRTEIPVNSVIIGVIILLFIGQAWIDSTNRLAISDTNIAQKSKLCLVEFTQKKCDTFNPQGECKSLLKCMQQKQKWQYDRIRETWNAFCQEILNQFGFPMVVIMLLLLMQVSKNIKKTAPRVE